MWPDLHNHVLPRGARGRFRLAASLAMVSAAGFLVGVNSLRAQDLGDWGAAPYLETGHWTLDALRRLEALGLLGDGYDRSGWTVDRNETLHLLRGALEKAEGDAGRSAMVGAYLDRFKTEFPDAGAERPGFRRGRGAASLSFRHRDGEVLTAVGWPPDADGWPPLPQVLPTALPRETSPSASLDASGYRGTNWAGRAQLAIAVDGVELGESYIVWKSGTPSFWVGRRHLRLGPGDGGIVLSGRQPLDGGGLELRPFRLPLLLHRLGPTRFQTAIVRLGEVQPYENPLLWTMRASIQPHSRLTLGVNRAVMVPGPEQMTAAWVWQFPLVLIGKHPDGELNRQDNQIVAIDVAYNVPLPSLPVMLYLEWGFEDSAGSWRAVPGIIGGAYIPSLRGAAWLGAGIEHASFSEMCCGNPWWYRHRGFTGGWTDDRRPLGHALGGHGREWLLRLDAAGWDARALTSLVVFRRQRAIENLYAPTYDGTSMGGALRTSVLLGSRFSFRADLEQERGDGWHRISMSLAGGVRF